MIIFWTSRRHCHEPDPIPDNAFTRLLALIGSLALIVAYLGGLILIAFVVCGALLGIGAKILGIDL